MSWAAVAVLIRIAPRIGLIDRPNERSLHNRLTPRGGGIGIVIVALSFVGGFVIWRGAKAPDSEVPLWTYFLTAMFIALVSLWDDFDSLGAGLRILCHAGAAATAVWGLLFFNTFEFPGLRIDLPVGVGRIFTIVWIVGLTNAYNFMDGIDGIAALQGIVAGFVWALAGAGLGSDIVFLFGLVLSGACIGFILLNWSPARIFMGDVGSAFLGFTFAVMPLFLQLELRRLQDTVRTGILPGFALLVVWPFVGDGLLTFMRRTLNGERVWHAHRKHLYQRLVQMGWSHARVSFLYGMCCVANGLAALCWLFQIPGAGLIAIVTPVLTLVGIYGFVSRRERAAKKSRS